MSKKLIVLLIVVVLLIGGFITYYYFTNKDALAFKKDFETHNNESFKSEGKTYKYKEVKVEMKNPVIYIKDEDILKELQNGSKMILFGSAENNDTREIVPTLFKAAKDNGVEEIYYYHIKDLEKKYEKGDKSAEKVYESIVKMLDKNLTEKFVDGKEKDKKKITVPTVIVVNKGKIVSYKSGKQEQMELYKIYENMMLDLIMCTDDC